MIVELLLTILTLSVKVTPKHNRLITNVENRIICTTTRSIYLKAMSQANDLAPVTDYLRYPTKRKTVCYINELSTLAFE